MLHGQDGLYAVNSLSHLHHTETFIWDGFSTGNRYKAAAGQSSDFGILRYIHQHKSLWYAFLILVLAMLSFVVFNYKRITRAMAIYAPQKNNSIAFMRMVAVLFEKEENHIELARYRITYLLDGIKHRYHIDTSVLDDVFKQKLADKANIPKAEVDIVITQIFKIKESARLDKTGFMHFNETLESFIKKIK
jgi:hypothetical protein